MRPRAGLPCSCSVECSISIPAWSHTLPRLLPNHAEKMALTLRATAVRSTCTRLQSSPPRGRPKHQAFVRFMELNPLSKLAYWRTGMSSHPQRRFLPVVTPISAPTDCRCAPMSVPSLPLGRMPPHVSSVNSVGKGPQPTRVVYALTTPMAHSILSGERPSPVHMPQSTWRSL